MCCKINGFLSLYNTNLCVVRQLEELTHPPTHSLRPLLCCLCSVQHDLYHYGYLPLVCSLSASVVVAQIRKGPRLQRVIQGVLTVGNAVNVGTAYGNAQGIKLDSLLKLADVKVCSLPCTYTMFACCCHHDLGSLGPLCTCMFTSHLLHSHVSCLKALGVCCTSALSSLCLVHSLPH